MTLRIKYTSVQPLNAGLKTLSLSSKNVLAMGSGEEEDWLLLNEVDAGFNLHPIEVGKMEKRLISQLSWSPSGTYLATTYDKLIIWQLSGGVLSMFRTYQGHALEITALCWAPDDIRLATTSLDGKIFVYSLNQEGILSKIDCGQKSVGICWDPFDKYIACLRFDNTVNFYKIDSWKQDISVSLQFQNKQWTSKREDRKIDWSPDCRYLIVPNLDDKTIPTVAILDRNESFHVVRTIIGPFSSINVVKFSPILFKMEGDEYCNVFAMGDNDGNISLWRIRENHGQEEQPLVLIKGHKKAGELIEDLTWSTSGTVLMATTSKKYIIMIDFMMSLGVPLGDFEKQVIIKDLYGDLKNTVKEIRIYQPKQNNNLEMKFEQVQILPSQKSTQSAENAIQQREQRVQTQFKAVFENGKKKLVPLEKENPTELQQIKPITEPSPLLLISQLETLPKSYSFQFNHRTLLLEVQKQQQRVFNQAVYGTMIRCMENGHVQWIDYVEGQVKNIQYNQDIIVIYTDQSLLYIENHKGMRQEAPFIMPFLSQLVVSPKNHILTLSTTGEFRVIDLNGKIIVYEGDIKVLMLHVYQWMDKKQLLNEDEKKGKQSIDPLIKANLRIDADGFPLVEFLFKDYCVYTYHKQLRQWVKTKQIDSNATQNSDFKNLKKLNFTPFQLPPQNDACLYKRLIQKSTMEDAITDVQVVSKLEEQLKQYGFTDECQQYLQVLYIYIKKLCDCWPNNQEKLATIIETMILNEQSSEFQYLQSRTDMVELRNRIIYILHQYPKTRDILISLFPNDL